MATRKKAAVKKAAVKKSKPIKKPVDRTSRSPRVTTKAKTGDSVNINNLQEQAWEGGVGIECARDESED